MDLISIYELLQHESTVIAALFFKTQICAKVVRAVSTFPIYCALSLVWYH